MVYTEIFKASMGLSVLSGLYPIKDIINLWKKGLLFVFLENFEIL